MKQRTKHFLYWMLIAFFCPFTIFGIPTIVSDMLTDPENVYGPPSLWPFVLLVSIAAMWLAYFALNANRDKFNFDDE